MEARAALGGVPVGDGLGQEDRLATEGFEGARDRRVLGRGTGRGQEGVGELGDEPVAQLVGARVIVHLAAEGQAQTHGRVLGMVGEVPALDPQVAHAASADSAPGQGNPLHIAHVLWRARAVSGNREALGQVRLALAQPARQAAGPFDALAQVEGGVDRRTLLLELRLGHPRQDDRARVAKAPRQAGQTLGCDLARALQLGPLAVPDAAPRQFHALARPGGDAAQETGVVGLVEGEHGASAGDRIPIFGLQDLIEERHHRDHPTTMPRP